ncbi:MacB family efflux pump subunit [Noviherbaspirillum malthae]|jgi:macrolide transport system ATP-binding/permease protein|uniref:MacB family efflux pump subunit n=1 Tax=Noviherbaspirillum malthae TaxID=1260987 RepID=UPI00188F05EB|nr:MacB family efflux pump subunit [Noviherbaspirillum malthae]
MKQPTAINEPLLDISHVSKTYTSGDSTVHALDDVSLQVFPGEFVAIMGQSGSGKSTLMNIIGCLDRPSEGSYRIGGQDVTTLSKDELASLRRDTFGFVFQRYNLLTSVTAAENVELPAIYAGTSRRERSERAQALLARLGLGERGGHRPNQLSGGQQQRVSIARALMNGAEIILADEPTGALDSKSGEEVLQLLKQLHAEGHTIVLITHDRSVADHAQRVVRIADGRVVDDSRTREHADARPRLPAPAHGGARWLPDLAEAVKMAMRSLRNNIFRSALTLLGVIIGVAAVVAMLAIGNGSKQQVLQRIESMGSNLLLVFPGAPGTRPSGDIATLVPADAQALKELPNITVVSPERSTRATVRYGSLDYQTNITGIWPGYAGTQDWKMARGSFITDADVQGYAPVIVLGQTVAKNLFPNGEDPIGRYLLVKSVPFEIVGVLAGKGANAFGSDMDNIALVPLSTGYMRLFGKQYLNTINIKVADAQQIASTQTAIENLLRQRHGTEDFQIRSTSSLLETAAETQNTLTVLLGSVAAISLLVGGIGVMNIMLVTVTERTREIGVRMATGARTANILLQFNTEALVVCGIGGLLGVAVGIGAGLAAQAFGMNVAFTAAPALLAFFSAFATGLLFGYLPARKAAHLDPVVALASE